MENTQGSKICVVQKLQNLHENFKIEGTAKGEHSDPMANLQSGHNMAKAMKHVFKYLNIRELLSASQVCSSWNLIAMDKLLWDIVRLKNFKVNNWDKCISAIRDQGSVLLDMRRMLIPNKMEDFDKFWSEYVVAIKKEPQLKYLALYLCPPFVVENTIYSLPKLTVLHAWSINDPSISKEEENENKWMTLSLRCLDQMTNLTKVKIRGLTGIKLTHLPSFESLVNLTSLSLTSIKAFPKDICRTLETLSTSLEFLEIGDCDCLSKDFAGVLKRLKNLTTLRLENCYGTFDYFAKEVFCSIRGLDKLKILELINIEFSDDVEGELEKCTNIKALLIIPAYFSQSAATNSHLIDCLKKLSKTLTHLVWGLTLEMLRDVELNSLRYQPKLQNYFKKADNMCIPLLNKSKHRFGKESKLIKTIFDMYSNEFYDILSVPGLENSLRKMMKKAETKVVKIPFQTTTRVYLLQYFRNL